ncbi:MAG: hypothetical protein ABI539_06915 [Acidobacteriota bacterium]
MPDPRELWPATFNKVWKTVNEKHYDPTFGGADWKKVRGIYEPQAMSAKSDAEFHGVLNSMLRELKLSHFAVLPRAADLQANRIGSGVAGITIKMLDGLPVADRVESGSAAYISGIRPGFVIPAIGNSTFRSPRL